VTQQASATGLAFLGFPPGTKINGSFELDFYPGVNLFVTTSINPIVQVPAGSGNSNGPDNVEISGGAVPEFATTVEVLNDACLTFDAIVDVNPTGLVTYSLQWNLGANCGFGSQQPSITLISAAFIGCRLSPAGPNTFPVVTTWGGGQYNNTVTGSLQSNTLQLTAEWLFNNPPIDAPQDALWTASWQLSDCPAVRLWDIQGVMWGRRTTCCQGPGSHCHVLPCLG